MTLLSLLKERATRAGFLIALTKAQSLKWLPGAGWGIGGGRGVGGCVGGNVVGTVLSNKLNNESMVSKMQAPPAGDLRGYFVIITRAGLIKCPYRGYCWCKKTIS